MAQPLEIPAQTRLLKANDLPRSGSKVAFNFEDLRQRGDAYVETIRKQVREMLAAGRIRGRDNPSAGPRRAVSSRVARRGSGKAAEQIEQRAPEIAEKDVARQPGDDPSGDEDCRRRARRRTRSLAHANGRRRPSDWLRPLPNG